jgi:hypothetical protein
LRSEYAQIIKESIFRRQTGPPGPENALRKTRKYSGNHVVGPPGTNPLESAWPLRGRNYNGRSVPKRDSSAGFRFAMSSNDRPEQTIEDSVVADAKPACVALVPVTTSAQWSQTTGPQPARPNSIFVTHLIATATQVPQTRSVRRATAADAQTAYRANRHQVAGAGIRTRQII